MTTSTLNSLAAANLETAGALNHREQVRVGLVADGLLERGWLANLTRQIKETAHAVVDPVVLFEAEEALEFQKEAWLFRLWRHLDRILFGTVPTSAASQLADHRLEFVSRGAERVRASGGCALSAAALEALKRSKPDLIVQIGGQNCIQELTGIAEHGVWWVPDSAAGTSNAWWLRAALKSHGVFETLLKGYSPHERQCRILRRSFAAVDGVSLSRNQASRRRKISELLIGELIDFGRSKAEYLKTLEDRERETLDNSHPEIASPPTTFELIRFFLAWACRGVARRIERCFWREHWFVAYRVNAGIPPASTHAMQNFHLVTSTSDRFYADPFAIEKDGKTYLFFEDYPFDKGKGLISYVEIDASGSCTKPETALECDYHLSYPHVFEHAGEIYMVPESMEARRVDLYRALDFPGKWTLEKTLLGDLSGVDPTIFFHNGKVWLFVSGVRSEHCVNEELFLFYADSLWGEWISHPANPIVSDVRRARPAGSLFLHDGQIIRPAQDCSASYGRAVSFNRIDVLSETEYRETPVSVIGPEWRAGNRGTHTFNQSQNLQTVDGRLLIRRYRRQSGVRSAVWKDEPASMSAATSASRKANLQATSAVESNDVRSLNIDQPPGRAIHERTCQMSAIAEVSLAGSLSDRTTRTQIRGSGLLVVGYVLELAINFTPHLLLVRYLATASYGAWAYALSLITAFQTVTLCLNEAMQRFVPIYHERREYGKLLGSIVVALATTVAIGSAFIAVFYLAPQSMAKLLQQQQAMSLMMLLIVLVPIEAIEILLMRLFACFHRARQIFYLQHIVAPLGRLVLVLVFILLHKDLRFLARGRIVLAIPLALLYGSMLAALMHRLGLFQGLRRRIVLPCREMFVFSSPMIVSTALSALENALIVLLLDRSRGVSEVAFYRVVVPVAMMNNMVMNAFSWLYVPSASRLLANDDHSGINHLYWRTAGWISVLTFPIFALTLCFAKPITTYLYGQRYAESGLVLAVLAIANYSNVALGFNGVTLKVLGRIRYVLKSNLTSALIKVSLCFLLIPRLGALGAAASVAAGIITYNLLMQRGLYRAAQVRIFDGEYLRIPLLIALATLSLFLLRIFTGNNVYLAVISTAIASWLVLMAARKELKIGEIFPEMRRVPLIGRFLA